MRILLTNDDGVNAPGLAVLERIARKLSDDVTIVAPSSEKSGAGRSLTLTQPLRLHQRGEKRYAVAGTPTDSVMMALSLVMKGGPPDLILSGVNRGANLGEDVSYSGTVSAAMEGALAGIRSIALSQIYAKSGAGPNVSFAAAEAWGERVLRPLIEAPWQPRTLFNINFPARDPDQVLGIRVVPQGLRDYGQTEIIQRTDPRGFDYYWLKLAGMPHTPAHSTDLEAAADGWVTVTPLHCDMTNHGALAAATELYR
ncbi:5'/3'-nucleotidase SurE [Rhizorhabdus dicambivorans]|uniref:5'-nucleotidase SurE n=1 Tax=Rhizorhabdus dicambivorans TaxID=1850238 RepID=A0A2A4FSF0_9SPHN|nr:5'/3'-nucleotidase SurE [Rhizorhabdus dicambivorans]ATE65411.1 5'/3'-nucleotidase SurE [Rhizorhabdus dicambivorans]PCE40624.1 5'/3'-nucleotidase SurE [Rhizorhabdus dicambivorans]